MPRDQINVSPAPQTVERIEMIVEKYGALHRAAKNRNTVIATICDWFIEEFEAILEAQDQALKTNLEGMRGARSMAAPSRKVK